MVGGGRAAENRAMSLKGLHAFAFWGLSFGSLSFHQVCFDGQPVFTPEEEEKGPCPHCGPCWSRCEDSQKQAEGNGEQR